MKTAFFIFLLCFYAQLNLLQSQTKSKLIETNNYIPNALKDLANSMVLVKGNTFTMGCTSEQGDSCFKDQKPIHQVTLSDFKIAKYELTQAQWIAVMDSNYSFNKDCMNCPVENISWNEVQIFFKQLNTITGKKYRLPTESEWEYAARGGINTKGYKYAGSNDLESVAWHGENSGNKVHAVGEKQANELGLYDMSGNVWEWCSDWYDAYKSNTNKRNLNPQGPEFGAHRTRRGGSWGNNKIDCFVAYRCNRSSNYKGFNLGIRVAEDL